MAFEALPSRPPIHGFVKSAAGSAAGHAPRGAPDFIHCRKQNVRVIGVKDEIRGARLVIHIKNFLPGLTSIHGPEHTALFVGAKSVSYGRNENMLGVSRVNKEGSDMLGIPQSDVSPGFSAIERLIDSITERNVVPQALLSRAYVNNVGV